MNAQEKSVEDTTIFILGSDTIRSYGNSPDSAALDSLLLTAADTLLNDSLPKDTNLVPLSDDGFDSEVTYNAKDSMIYDFENNKVRLYGDAVVKYQQIELKAAYIEYGFEDNKVNAFPTLDTANNPIGKPQFSDNGQAYEADTIRYDFDTKKGYIKGVYTNISDGHIYGQNVKKDTNDVLYIENAEFCPCEDKDALTRFRVNKIKVIPDDKVVTGPGYMKLGPIPTPLAFPFGLFPNSEKRAAGIVIPNYGESAELGFYLINGGYYTPLGEKADLKITGDIYSKGSYGFKGDVGYTSRYKHNGNFNLTYNVLKNGYKEFPPYSATNSLFVRWNHRQDAKKRPGTSFSASVNAGSSSTFTNTINASYNDYLSNTFRSSISYAKTLAPKLNMTINFSHTQNTQTRQFDVNLPDAALNLSRVYLPLGFLKGKNNAKSYWFEKIGLTYSANLTNRLSTTEEKLQLNNLAPLKTDFKNGMKHDARLQTSLKAFNFTINPQVSYTERWYLKTFGRSYDTSYVNNEKIDTLLGFQRVNNYQYSANVTTVLYGMFAYKRGPIKAIRHMITPSATLNYNPGFDTRITESFGPDGESITYSPYDGTVYGGPSPNESGGVALNLNNNLEMKVRDRKDTTGSGTKKVKLIDALTFSTSYDAFRDSLKWSSIRMSGRTTLFKVLNLNYSATLDPYNFNDSTGTSVDQSLWKARKQLVRMRNSTFALTYGFNPSNAKAKKREKPAKSAPLSQKLRYLLPDGIPISVNTSYNLNITKQYRTDLQRDTSLVTQSISLNGNLQLLRKIKIGYQTGYDFVQKEVIPTNLNLYWDLNCWEFRFTYVPNGFRKSYFFSINMKSTLLRDLKYEKRKNLSGNDQLF